jgi:hypothetical protein
MNQFQIIVAHDVANIVETGPDAGGVFDWRRCEAAATILSHCPDDVALKEMYYRMMGPQVNIIM